MKQESLLKNLKLTKTELNKFIDIFSHYSKGKWVYPGAIHRVTKIDIKKVYQILNILEKEKAVEHYYEIICSDCKRSTGEVYKHIDDIPEDYYCEYCENEGISMDNAIMIYKVL